MISNRIPGTCNPTLWQQLTLKRIIQIWLRWFAAELHPDWSIHSTLETTFNNSGVFKEFSSTCSWAARRGECTFWNNGETSKVSFVSIWQTQKLFSSCLISFVFMLRRHNLLKMSRTHNSCSFGVILPETKSGKNQKIKNGIGVCNL